MTTILCALLAAAFLSTAVSPELLSDCNQNGMPDDREELSDCNENDEPDVCELEDWTGSDCNLTGALDECEWPQLRFHRAAAPGLEGIYGGYTGGNAGVSDFDFGVEFLQISSCWVELSLDLFRDQHVNASGDGLSMTGMLNGTMGASVSATPGYELLLCAPLPVEAARLEGTGTVRLSLGLPCCDLQFLAPDAAIYYEGMTADSPMSLAGHADFQTCFGEQVIPSSGTCDRYDVSGDLLVNLEDHSVLHGPGAE